MAILELIAEQGTGLFYTLDGRETVIGRLPECDIVLPGTRVSRKHARVSPGRDGFVVEDLGSRNGTLHNGSLLDGPQVLENGDKLVVDESRFVFHADPPARAPFERASGVTGTIVFDPNTTVRPAANPEAQLKAVFSLSRELASSVSLDQIQLGLLAALFRIFPVVRRGFVLLPDEDGRLRLTTRRLNADVDAEPPTLGPVQHACEECFADGKSLLFVDDPSTGEFDASDAAATLEAEGGSRSIMCAPLVGSEGAVYGVVQLDRRGLERPFSMDDLETFSSVAAIAGQSVENNRLHAENLRSQLRDKELELAARVQRLLVPSQPPTVQGFEVFHYYEPAREVGGDYFDYLPLSDGRLAVAIGDVAGKDVSAALLMTRLSAAVRLCLDVESDLARAVDRVNRVVVEPNVTMRFVTFLVCVLDPREETVQVVVAGHVPPVLRRADGTVEVVQNDVGGPPLGIRDDPGYRSFEFPLRTGDTFFLCTDGIPEAHGQSRELYGMDRLVAALGGEGKSAGAVGRAVLDDVSTFVAGEPPTDDVCVVTVRRVGLANSGE